MLFGEHVLKTCQHCAHRGAFQLTQMFDKPLNIDSAKLIEHNEPCATLEAATRTPWVRASASRHGRGDYGPEMLVQFVR
jgi:hypothetical protein